MKARQQEQKRDLAEEIAAAVLQGAYRPGEWLRQIDLERSFNANRFDVRRALDELAARGTLTHVPNRGHHVAAPDLNAIRELLEIRALLEVEAATQALPHIKLSGLVEIKACQHAFEHAMVDGSSADQAKTNMAFHDSIYRFTPNKALAELIIQMRNRAVRGPVILWPSHAKLQRSAAHHKDIVAAIEAGDRELLAFAVRRHITESRANYPPSQDTGASPETSPS